MNAHSCAPAQHMHANALPPPELRTYPESMRATGYCCTNNGKIDYNCYVDPARIWDVNGNSTHWRGRAPGQPFLVVFNHMTTHEVMLFDQMQAYAAPGSVLEAPVSLLDLAPTLLSLSGVPQAAQMLGKPFVGPADAPRA